MTVEGEKDDISGVGQTEAAHDCAQHPGDMQAHYVQPKVGHYGVFNGSRFRAEIAPRIADFIANCDQFANRQKGEGASAAGASVTLLSSPQAARQPGFDRLRIHGMTAKHDRECSWARALRRCHAFPRVISAQPTTNPPRDKASSSRTFSG